MRDALPKASFIGFTDTPIESDDKNTQAVFGDLGGVPNTCEFVSPESTFARANCGPKPATS
jgi:type I restriction enzyme, R subunit